jgi:hypothetical protein
VKEQTLPPVIESAYKGLAPLQAFSAAWIEENAGVAAFEKLVAMMQDVLNQANVLAGVKK